MRNSGLTEAYDLIVENENKNRVNAPKMAKPGEDMIEGGTKKAKGMGTESPSAKGIKKPQEMETNKNPGHGKIYTEDKEISNMVPDSKFDQLFKSTLIDEESIDNDMNPLEQTGDEEFNDESGDFSPEGSVEGTSEEGEEVDVATELRLIIDRLTEVAERLGAYEGESEEGDLGGEEEGSLDIGAGAEGDEVSAGIGEAVTYGKGGKGKAGGPNKGSADGKLKAYGDKTKQVTNKSNMKVKSAFEQTMKGKGSAGGPGKGSADGKLKSFPDTAKKMQSKGNMVVNGGSKTSKVGRSIFD